MDRDEMGEIIRGTDSKDAACCEQLRWIATINGGHKIAILPTWYSEASGASEEAIVALDAPAAKPAAKPPAKHADGTERNGTHGRAKCA
jgi:hypothetical protein